MTIITRFAPSPTGFLHIGGARTALFNWLFSRHHGGKFFLRIEDTDRARSTQEAINAILDGMQWLGLDWDSEPVYQFSRSARHAEIAYELLKSGKAFKCYHTEEELRNFRENNKSGRKFLSNWRLNPDKPPPSPDARYVIRLKVPHDNDISKDIPGEETVIEDHVQGRVVVRNNTLDDLVMLRSDGTPTYMLAVVADDHDMGITHVIRGDDHLTNAAKQIVIYRAMAWVVPEFAHIPLIHGPDGAKLSKRHGALGVEAYREMGYLPEAMRNYLLRLGWSHGDEEIISTEKAVEWFNLESVGKSPSRFDFTKLENLNGHYIREAEDARLVELITSPHRGEAGGGHGEESSHNYAPSPPGYAEAKPLRLRPGETLPLRGREILLRAMPGLKARAKTLVELAQNAAFYVARRPLKLDEKAQDLLNKGGREIITALLPRLEALEDFGHEATMLLVKTYADEQKIKLGQAAQPLRAALTGSLVSPGVFEVMEILGKEESLGRLQDVC